MGETREPRSVPVPDLLHPEPGLRLDPRAMAELLEVGFLGKDTGIQIDGLVAEARSAGSSWQPELFAEDLFVAELLAATPSLPADGQEWRLNRSFLQAVLTRPPRDVGGVRFRQAVLAELHDSPDLRHRAEVVYAELSRMIAFFKAPGMGARLDPVAFRIDTLRQIRHAVSTMTEGFEEASSGLRRIAESGRALIESSGFRHLAELLDYESRMATMRLEVAVGVDGRTRQVVLQRLEENRGNRFHRPVWRRFLTRLSFWWRGYRVGPRELIGSAVFEVFRSLSLELPALIQLVSHLELYLWALDFRRRAEGKGLAVSLAEVSDDVATDFSRLFNPLLLVGGVETPVPTDLHSAHARSLTVVTGPNSGGKTRLLQALGWAQLLGQSGLFVPAERAALPIVQGLFVSLIEREAPDQTEGRLGRELIRIRRLFEELQEHSLVLLDELCSGTNPSEGVEVFEMVLRLLRPLHPIAFVTTHFLDLSRRLSDDPPVPDLEFLRGGVDETQHPTYRFSPGIAETSLAAKTAERLGVTFAELASLVERRQRRRSG